MNLRRGLVAVFFLMAAPSAASAATGPLLSLTPERVTGDRLALARQPWRVRVVMQPWVEGQTATVRFYRHGHKLRVVNVNLTMDREKMEQDAERVKKEASDLVGKVKENTTGTAKPSN